MLSAFRYPFSARARRVSEAVMRDGIGTWFNTLDGEAGRPASIRLFEAFLARS